MNNNPDLSLLQNPVLKRFYNNVFEFPYASDGKNDDDIFQPCRKTTKEIALTKPNIQNNGPRRISYINFDIDRKLGGLAWEDANLPPPNIIGVNPKNGHANLTYELAEPIWLPKKDCRYESKAVKYYKAVRQAMQRALQADTAYNGLLVKNPLHKAWNVSCPCSQPYDLSELSRHLDLSQHSASSQKLPDDIATGRRSILFESGRRWAYGNKKFYDNITGFRQAVEFELDQINQSFTKGPELWSVVRSTAKSIAKWVWNIYTGDGSWQADNKNRKVMDLDQSIDITIRQQLGQTYTCTIRKGKTLDKIKATYSAIQNEGGSLTKSAIARRANLNRKTVRRYWQVVTESLVVKPPSFLSSFLSSLAEGETGFLRNKSSRGYAQPEGYSDTPNSPPLLRTAQVSRCGRPPQGVTTAKPPCTHNRTSNKKRRKKAIRFYPPLPPPPIFTLEQLAQPFNINDSANLNVARINYQFEQRKKLKS